MQTKDDSGLLLKIEKGGRDNGGVKTQIVMLVKL